jgi:hypothetical protein
VSTFSNVLKLPLVQQFKSNELIKNPYAIAGLAVLLLATLALTVAINRDQSSAVSNAQVATNSALYVSPSGLDTNDGASPSTPLKTIQAALNKATPGTTINLAEGIYREKPATKIHGTVDAPIIIKGPELGKDKAGRYKAVLHGTGRIFNIDHNYYVLDGFTIDGNESLKDRTYPTTLAAVEAFKDANQADTVDSKLIYIGSADTTRDLTGIKITNMFLHGAGTECIRIRNNAQNNIVENSVIEWCGMYGGGSSDQYKYHNGEGVYIGTSPKSTTQPMYANDGSSFNIIRNNTIYTFGSECLEVKENAHDNTFENNDCRYNDEPYSYLGSNIELRGYNNKIIGNTIMGSRSIGLKMKSDSTSYTQGGNSAQNNNFSEIANESIRNDQSTAQGLFCGNTFTGTILVGSSVGNPTAPCPTPTNTPTPTLTGTLSPTPMACVNSTASWQNTSIPAQTGTFTATFLVTPNNANLDGVLGFSNGVADAFSDLAAVVRFNDVGSIDARNGSAYQAATSVAYSPGIQYAVRMEINVSTRRYSVYVKPVSSAVEQTIAANYTFRSEQASVTTLSNMGMISDPGLTMSRCALTVTQPTPTPTLTPTPTPTAGPPTNTPTPTIPSQTYTLYPIADSYVNSGSSGTNYGTRTTMIVDSSPTNISYLKFDLTPLAGKTIVNATLRVRTSSDGSSNSHRVKPVSSTTWTETGIKYSNRPSLGSTVATISSGGRTNTWQQVAITSTVAANVGNLFSLGIDSSGSDSITFSTRESSYKPELVIQVQ